MIKKKTNLDNKSGSDNQGIFVQDINFRQKERLKYRPSSEFLNHKMARRPVSTFELMFKKKVLPKKKQLEITDGETVIDIATYRYTVEH